MTTFVAAATLTAAQMNTIQPRLVIKSADSTNATGVLASDADLFITFGSADVGTSFWIEASLGTFGSATTADIQVAWARTGTLTNTATRHCLGPATATAGVTNTSMNAVAGFALASAVQYGTDAASNGLVKESFVIRVDVAGTLTLQWASVGAGTTTLRSSSRIIAIPVL